MKYKKIEKIEINKIYGIYNELILDFEKKNKMIIFAPNGIGKTSLARGIEDVMNNQEYNGMEKEHKNKKLIVKFNNKIFSYKNKNDKEDFFYILNKNNIYENLEDLKNILSDIELNKLNNPLNEKIIKFWYKCQKELENYFNFKNSNNNEKEISINWIFEEIEKYLKFEKKDIDKLSDKLKNYDLTLKLAEKIKNNKNNKKIGEYFDLIDNKLFKAENDKIIDFIIIKDIINKKKKNQDVFGYKEEKNKKYLPISKLNNFIKKMENKYLEIEINFINLIKKIDKDDWIKKNKDGKFNKKYTINGFIKNNLNKKIENIKNDILANIIKNKKNEYKKIKIIYDQKSKKIIKKINEKIIKINNFFNEGNLDWKIKINKLNSLTQKISASFLFNQNKKSSENFFEYSSEGQKKTLLLISWIIKFQNKNVFIVLDDIFTSLDINYTNEILEILNNKSFSKINFLILIHNFDWLRTMAFSKFGKKVKFIILDKIEKDKNLILINSKKENLISLIKLDKINFNKISNIKILIFLSSILREILKNYILLEKEKSSKLEKEKSSKQKNIIKFLDSNLRHYKNNINVNNIIEEFKNIIKNNFDLFLWQIINKIKKILNEIKSNSKNDEIFGEYVIKEKIEWNKIKDIDEYIINKIFMGTQIRFQMEKNIYYDAKYSTKNLNKKNEIIKKWENSNEWEKAFNLLNENLKKIINNKINFLVHSNQIQWNKIIEIPIYKINLIKEKLKKQFEKFNKDLFNE